MSKKMLLVDGHVHLYPNYDLARALKIGIVNLERNGKELFQNSEQFHGKMIETTVNVLLLTERFDCHFFDQLRKFPLKFENNGLKISQTAEQDAIRITSNQQQVFYIIAGHQVVTVERLEILALTTSLLIEDRKYSIGEVIEKVNDAGGIPVLNWAPGKWFFNRGKAVQQAFEQFSPQQVLIGDTSLRHTLWPEPRLMTRARKAGFKVIAGSDPLPFAGEESLIGSYGFSVKGAFDTEKPVTSLRKILRDENTKISYIGKRNNVFTFAKREAQIMANK